jgi:hypothetical protein
MEKKIIAEGMKLLIAVASLSVVLLIGISIAAEGRPSPTTTTSTTTSTNYNGGSSNYKQTACLNKVLELGQRGIISDVGGFNGGLFECSQIQWSGSIYEVLAK